MTGQSDPGNDGGKPPFEERQEMWRTISVTPLAAPSGPLGDFVAYLAELYSNGSVLYRAFEFSRHPVLEWFWSRNQIREMFFLDKFLSLSTVRGSLGIESVDDDLMSHFEELSPLVVPGCMAWALDNGGAYERPEIDAREALELATAAVDQMLDEKFEEVCAFKSDTAWSSFFSDVAWDYTWILVQKEPRRAHVLMATDTD